MYSCSRHQEVSKFLMHLMQSLASLRDVLREHETFTYIISLLYLLLTLSYLHMLVNGLLPF